MYKSQTEIIMASSIWVFLHTISYDSSDFKANHHYLADCACEGRNYLGRKDTRISLEMSLLIINGYIDNCVIQEPPRCDWWIFLSVFLFASTVVSDANNRCYRWRVYHDGIMVPLNTSNNNLVSGRVLTKFSF